MVDLPNIDYDLFAIGDAERGSLETATPALPVVEPEPAPKVVGLRFARTPTYCEAAPEPPEQPPTDEAAAEATAASLAERLAHIKELPPSRLLPMFEDFYASSGDGNIPPERARLFPTGFLLVYEWWLALWPYRETERIAYDSFRRFLLTCESLRVRDYPNTRDRIDSLSAAFSALLKAHARVRIGDAVTAILYLARDGAMPLKDTSLADYVETSPRVKTTSLLELSGAAFLDWLLTTSDYTVPNGTSESAKELTRLQGEISKQFLAEVALPSIAYLKAMDSVALSIDDLTTAFESDRDGSADLLGIALRLVEARKIASLLMDKDTELAAMYLDIVKATILKEAGQPHPAPASNLPPPRIQTLGKLPAQRPATLQKPPVQGGPQVRPPKGSHIA